jgi:hypothetical protein
VTQRRCGILLAICGAVWAFGLFQCGVPPTAIPDPYTGILKITAMDTLIVDSVSVALDDIPQGRRDNPCILGDVVVGIHKVFVQNPATAGASATVEIFRDRRTDLVLTLLSQGPFVGNVAPDFSVRTIDDSVMQMQKQRGKVVLLVFFEHT